MRGLERRRPDMDPANVLKQIQALVRHAKDVDTTYQQYSGDPNQSYVAVLGTADLLTVAGQLLEELGLKSEGQKVTLVGVDIARAAKQLRPVKAPPAAPEAAPPSSNHGVALGAIFVSSWGYEQTNVSYYQVVGVRSASVVIRKIESHVVGNNGYENMMMPSKDQFRGEPKLKRVGVYSGRPGLRISSYESAFLWDGKPQRQTDSRYGH